jgi:hypothetical protein
MTGAAGARFVASLGNGHLPVSAAPSAQRYRETIAVLATALAAIVRDDPERGAAIALAAIMRAGETAPDVMRLPEVRAALAIGAALTEVAPRRVLPAAPIQPVAAPPMQAPPPAAPPVAPTVEDAGTRAPPQPLGVPELQARIEMLEKRREAAKLRGDHANVRTVGTAITQTRKRLRALTWSPNTRQACCD